MTAPDFRRRRIPTWGYVILAGGALLAMATVTIAPAMLSCGGVAVHVSPPPSPLPAADEIAQNPAPSEDVARP